MRMRYIDDFIEHLWNTCYRKIERQKAARDLAGWTRRRKTTKDPEDSRRHDWGCGWGWGWGWSCGCQQDMHGRIEHFTPTKDNKKNTEEEATGVPQCRIWVSAADTEITGRLWASPLRWLWLPREKKEKKREKKRRKAADERAECDHKCHKEESRSWQTNENRESCSTWLMALIGQKPSRIQVKDAVSL